MTRPLVLLAVLLACSAAPAKSADEFPPEVSSWLEAHAAPRDRTAEGQNIPYYVGRPGASYGVALFRGQADHLLYVAVFQWTSDHYSLCCTRQISGEPIDFVYYFGVLGDGVIELSGRRQISSERYFVRLKFSNGELTEAGPSNNSLERP